MQSSPMLDLSSYQLRHLAVHYIGNPIQEEQLRLSEAESGIDDRTLKVVHEYLNKAFKEPEYYHFWHPTELEMNPVFDLARKLFSSQEAFLEHSQQLAQLLYHASQHPQVKSGEFMVLYLERVQWGEEKVPAIALFKCEEKEPFLFTEEQDQVIDLYSYRGISPRKVDKAALILQCDEGEGFQVKCVDNRNKGEETVFWFDHFLQLKRRNTEYTQTAELISMTKQFIDQDLASNEPLERNEALGLLQKSKSYFSEQETFDTATYGQEVFEDPAVADRFQAYVAERATEDLDLQEGFAISSEAFKKKQSVFKSVLKLDKNFHIYIHGNRELIEKGTDGDGRKYYKVYYEEEH